MGFEDKIRKITQKPKKNSYKTNKMLKKFKPTSPGIRNTILIKKPKKLKNINKKLLLGKKNKSGRNFQGKITVWGRGSGHAKKHRVLDFWRNGLNGVVKEIEYDPNRSANI